MDATDLIRVRHDPAHCLARGLFQRLEDRKDSGTPLFAVYQPGSSRERVEFSGPERLDANDLRVLQGLIALASAQLLLLDANASSIEGLELLRQLTAANWDIDEDGVAVVDADYRSLAGVIGYTDVYHTASLKKCVRRLHNVSIAVHGSSETRRFGLLYEYPNVRSSSHLCVALNPRITAAMLLEGKAYTYIDMEQVRALQNNPARILHQQLSAWIDFGQARKVGLDVLVAYLWPECAVTAAATRRRRAVARQAIQHLVTVGWQVTTTDNKNMYLVAKQHQSQARILHKNLCSLIAVGHSLSMSIRELVRYSRDAKTKVTDKDLLANIPSALRDMESVGWSVAEEKVGRFTISRPTGNPTHVLFEQLCMTVTCGTKYKFSLDDILHRIWLGTCTPNSLPARSRAAELAVWELRAAGWSVARVDGMFEVERPERKRVRDPGEIATRCW